MKVNQPFQNSRSQVIKDPSKPMIRAPLNASPLRNTGAAIMSESKPKSGPGRSGP